ncbi:MAG: Gfo/Idh/MocA family oxidoreductase [Anaerolineae bacterium]|nr:Gfo/Idh/MocA family oxidoreductase [Anaerolineae bacterium]
MAVRIGFIGTGGIAQMHLRNLQRLEQAQVVGVFDVDPDRAQAAALMFAEARVYQSYQALLEQGSLDAVYVCLPPFAHERQEIDAAAAGVNLFVEKPIAITIERAREINEAIQRAGVIAAVGYNWRWLDITDRAREILKTTPIALALGYWLGGMPGVPWWRRKDQSGGQIVEQTTHIFDLARYLLGEVEWVHAVGFQGLMSDVQDYSTEDASVVTLKFASGTIATIASTDLLPSGAGKIGLDLIGRDVRVEHANRTLTVYRRGERTTYDALVDPYLVEDQAFVEAVATGDASRLRSTYPDAVKTHLVTMTANRSLETGQVERVPLE